MIIKDINILAFGKLKNKQITLTRGLNVIYGRNESGKSTVSAFIEAMLYSFPSRDENRKKYFPWDNTPPSGIMSIEHDGKSFTIYRSFAATPKADTFRTEPDISLDDFLPDRDTYRKSIYCAEGKASDFDRTSAMDTRVSNILATGDETLNADAAIAKLKEQKKVYTKQRGGPALLQQTERAITELENELVLSRMAEENILYQREAIINKEETISHLHSEISLCEAQISDFEASVSEIDASITSQRDYIASLPASPLMHPDPKEKKPSFPLLMLVLSCICSLAMFIIGFLFFAPLLFFCWIPLLLSGLFFTFKKKQPHEVAADYQMILRERNEAFSDLEKLNAQKSSLIKQISHSREKITELQRELIYQNEQFHSLDKKISLSTERSADEIESDLSYKRSQREEIRLKIAAIDAAIDAIEYAKERFSEDFTPIVTKKAEEYIALIAPKQGRNVSLTMDSDNKKRWLNLSVKDPLPQKLSDFSYGFNQEVYLCFRLALSDFLFGDTLPVILDDPFLGSDDYREMAIINLLASVAQTKQVIVFTNRKNNYFTQLNCNFVDIGAQNDV